MTAPRRHAGSAPRNCPSPAVTLYWPVDMTFNKDRARSGQHA